MGPAPRDLRYRERYRNSGGFKPAHLLLWGLIAGAVAIALGVVLHLAYMRGVYIILIAPLLAGALLAGIVYLAVRQSHCRNRWMAGLVGLIAGLLLYLSYYHSGLVEIAGLQNAHRVDVLPKYIQMRLQTDIVADVGRPVDPNANRQGEFWMNSLLFLLELALVCMTSVGLGIHRAVQPYSEVSGEWMLEHLAVFPPGAGRSLVDALESGRLHEWMQSPPERQRPAIPFSQIVLHFDPALIDIDPEAPVYLTVKETEVVQQGMFLKKRTPVVRTLVQHIQLLPDEIAALRALFFALKPKAAPSVQAVERPIAAPTGTVRVEPLPADDSGRVLSPSYRLLCRFHAAVVVGMTVYGIGALLAGPVLGLAGVRIGPAPPWGVAMALIASGLVCLTLLLKVLLYFQRQGNRVLYERARREFALRPDAIVDFDDPNMVFVDIAPRANWRKSNWMLETASDVGFLAIDSSRRMLLFEGDRERYWIPAGAILGCEVEQVEPPSNLTAQTDHYPHFVAVVRANHRDGPWEAPFSVRHDPNSRFRGRSHQSRAQELRERILKLVGASSQEAN